MGFKASFFTSTNLRRPILFFIASLRLDRHLHIREHAYQCLPFLSLDSFILLLFSLCSYTKIFRGIKQANCKSTSKREIVHLPRISFGRVVWKLKCPIFPQAAHSSESLSEASPSWKGPRRAPTSRVRGILRPSCIYKWIELVLFTSFRVLR